MTVVDEVTLRDYVRVWARRSPQAPAVSGPDGELSYAGLDRLAGQLAAGLRAAGVATGDRVVLWAGKSTRAVAAMQAALRLGAPYVPVSAANPPARAQRIAADCAAALVVADPDAADRARRSTQDGAVRVITFDELAELGADGPPPPVHHSAPDELAYVLYTSGSTGAPKGVCLSHRNACAFVDWAGDLLGVGPADRLANHAPFNFDLSVFDLYAAFRAGASVHLVPPEMAYAPAQLARFIRERQISVWYSVPSAVSLMIRDGGLLDGPPPPALRACVVAGEAMPIRYVHQLRAAWPGVRLLNWYGPTETNVCTSYEVSDADAGRTRPLPIGTAACADTVVLDPGGDEQGEIVVTGPTVMLGYWGHPPHRGPYRTGDIGRYAEDGNLEYLGRSDHMVKVRGHRIEPAEIEAVIAGHPAVADVAVVVAGTGLDAALTAVVVTVDGARRPGLLEFKRLCAQRLPTYMIVDQVRVVEKMPRTPNGKTDRSALVAAIEGGEL